MKIPSFIVIGENIHCTRILKRDGASIVRTDDGGSAIVYGSGGARRMLPIPEPFTKRADWESGKVKRCAVAIWQGMYGNGAARGLGADYIQTMACEQEKAGAAFIDINVDEFSVELDERVKAMKWTVGLVQKACRLPLSIDSANQDVMQAGLMACDPSRGRPMINSISLERPALMEPAAEHKAAVVVSATGEAELPASMEERLTNLGKLIPMLENRGIPRERMYVDPLVYTISTDSRNGRVFLETVASIRRAYGSAIHVTGGLSNVSFGMPCRKLINQVFARLSVEFGGDSGIVDPLQINLKSLESLDEDSEPFKLARALLMGEDEFGMNFISAHREGKLI